MRHQQPTGPGGLRMPELTPWVKQTLIGLFVLYVAELVGWSIGLPLQDLVWRPIGAGFSPLQWGTRFLIQGPSAVLSVLISLLVLYFFLPAMTQTLRRQQLLEAVAFGAVGGTVAPFAVDLLGLGAGTVSGWSGLIMVLVVLFGMARPSAEVLLFFVLPVKGIHFVWGSLAFSALFFLSALATGGATMGSAEALGIWAGAYGWWHYRGPDARRRVLKKKAGRIERELERFQVLPGGRPDNRPKDETWH